jgi:hypothetical protein
MTRGSVIIIWSVVLVNSALNWHMRLGSPRKAVTLMWLWTTLMSAIVLLTLSFGGTE